MPDGALVFYESVDSFEKIEELVRNGQPETVHLECKLPEMPQLTQEVQKHLARTACAFVNTAGGVILYGVETGRHTHQKTLDIMKQVPCIANAADFQRQVEAVIPRLTFPAILGAKAKVVKRNAADSMGVVVLYVPYVASDPFQCALDGHFYYRAGDQCTEMPYDMIKRLFAGTESPDLVPKVMAATPDASAPSGTVKLGIGLENRSSASGESVDLLVFVLNPTDFDEIRADLLKDVAEVNPGRRVWAAEYSRSVHKGLFSVCGYLRLRPKATDAAPEVQLVVKVLARKMNPRAFLMTVRLTPAPAVTACTEVPYQ